MADFVSAAGVTLPTTPVTPNLPGIHDPNPSVSPTGTYTLVSTKIAETMQLAQDWMVRLVGADGQSGYMGC